MGESKSKSKSEMQKAWLYKEYGAVEKVIEMGQIPIPEISCPDQVLIKVMAAGLNPIDYMRASGKFREFDTPLPHVPGYDVAGVVVKVGEHVTKFKEGDEVYGDINEHALVQPKRCGALTQYTISEERLLAHKPKNLSFMEAATIPLVVQTAQEGFDRVKFKPGQTVLIIGGSGGVGSMAIQLAKEVYGASHIATTTSTSKLNFVKGLGTDTAIDYTTIDYTQLPEKYDFVFDTVGEPEKSVKAVKKGGIVALITAHDHIPEPAFRFILTSNGAKLEKRTPYFESGKIKAILDPRGPYKFSEMIEGLKYLETGRVIGKLVVFPMD